MNKIKLVLLFFLFVTLRHNTGASICQPMNKEMAQGAFEKVDYILTGRAFKHMEYDPDSTGYWRGRQAGAQVAFKIDSVLKGNITVNEVVILNQFSSEGGQAFEFGDQYLIVGNRITGFINETPDYCEDGDEIPEMVPNPLPPSILRSKVHCYNYVQEEVSYWDDLAKSETVVNTSFCWSFRMGSEDAEYFLE